MTRFKEFTDDELYVLKRQAVESSWEIIMSGNYAEDLTPIHSKIWNEVLEEISNREAVKYYGQTSRRCKG